MRIMLIIGRTMSNLNFVETLIWGILLIMAIYASGLVYLGFWRYFYQQRGRQTKLQTERVDEEGNYKTPIIAWVGGLLITSLLIKEVVWQFEPPSKGLIFGIPLMILIGGFLGLSVPEIWAIWHKRHHR